MSLRGTIVGNIRVQSVLGRGGMGEVYAGRDEKLRRTVALKAIRREHALDPAMKSRFLKEARVLSRLAHPNICQIFDYIEGDDCDLLVLELIDGRNLKELLVSGLDAATAMRIALQTADVLVAAHAEGVVHRDLKPANVMLTHKGEVKVLDFGLARSLGEEMAVRRVSRGLGDQEGTPGGISGDAQTVRIPAGEISGEAETVRMPAGEVSGDEPTVRIPAGEISEEAETVRMPAGETIGSADRTAEGQSRPSIRDGRASSPRPRPGRCSGRRST